MNEVNKLSESEILELHAAITQLEEWSDDCTMRCPLGRLVKSVLKILHHCQMRPDEMHRKDKK
jgi:hypothetical protein